MLGVWSTTVGLHPAEVALSLICMSLKSHQLSHLHFFLSLHSLPSEFFLFSSSSSSSISHILPLLRAYCLSGCVLPSFSPAPLISEALLTSWSPVHLHSQSSCITMTALLSPREHVPVSVNVDFHSNHEPGSRHEFMNYSSTLFQIPQNNDKNADELHELMKNFDATLRFSAVAPTSFHFLQT